MMPGQPVERHADPVLVERLAQRAVHLGGRSEVAVGVETPLGSPVEPEVNRILAGVSAAMCRRRSAAEASIEQLASAPKARPRLPSTVTIVRVGAVEGGGVARGLLGEDQAGLDDRQRVIEAREVAGQRVVGRDRRHERAGAEGAEHQEGVLEAVVGQDGDRLALAGPNPSRSASEAMAPCAPRPRRR